MTCSQTSEDIERVRLLAALAWHRDMGADEAADEEATNWLSRGDQPPLRISALMEQRVQSASMPSSTHTLPAGSIHSASARSSVPTQAEAPAQPVRSFTLTPPDIAQANARKAALSANTLHALRDALDGFDGCGLKSTAKNLCFFRGVDQARVMVIGEAPGSDEDRCGIPFVGRAGKLLDKMLQTIGLDDSCVHITNAVYWRPPGNRTPSPQEVLVCKPFLQRQIDLVAPEIIITVGGPAAHTILDTTQGIMRLRGKWGTITTTIGAVVRVMPTLHPAYLLRTPPAKRLVWRDLLAIEDALHSQTE